MSSGRDEYRTPPAPYYERHGITIYRGDCLDVLPLLDLEGVNAAVLTDPPYNAGKKYGAATDDRRPWKEWAAWLDVRFASWDHLTPDTFMFLSQTAYRHYVRHGVPGKEEPRG